MQMNEILKSWFYAQRNFKVNVHRKQYSQCTREHQTSLTPVFVLYGPGRSSCCGGWFDNYTFLVGYY